LVDHVQPVQRLGLPAAYFRDLGFVPREQIGRLYRLADVLVQPGAPDLYNDYRFPSKLPEFFASGRPVILPHTNIGRQATDGENCLLLHTGSPDEIAAHLARLHQDPGLREQVGRAGRRFADTHFSWPRAAQVLRGFYPSILGASQTAAAGVDDRG
jgi:glycosyltransferase involved in cell wall biosynthesis